MHRPDVQPIRASDTYAPGSVRDSRSGAVKDHLLRRAPGLAGCGLGILLWICATLLNDVSAFDFSRYEPRTMKDLIRDYPVQTGLAIIPNIPIRSRVAYSSEFRELAEDSRRLIAAWAESMDAPRAPLLFRQELKIHEAGSDYWVPVQESLVPAMRAELRPKEEIELFMIYIGQVEGRHIFLVNEFGHESPH